jgi:hypothetical protein
MVIYFLKVIFVFCGMSNILVMLLMFIFNGTIVEILISAMIMSMLVFFGFRVGFVCNVR